MDVLLRTTWIVTTVLRYGGVLTLFAGTLLFGVYFIAGNARSPDGGVPPSSWQGAGPRKGLRIFAGGIAMLLAAYLIGLLMPNGR